MSIAPKKMTQRAQNALKTREKLFTTALSLFSQYGYNVVTVDDIAAEAGVSKGTFYANFPSKNSVLLEQFRLIDEFYEQVFNKVDASMSGIDRITLLFGTMFDYCENVVGVGPLRVIYADQITSVDSVRILNNRDRVLYRILRENIDLAKVTGEISGDTATEQLVEDLLRISKGVIYDWCMFGNDFNLAVEGNRMIASVLRWIRMDAAQKKTVD